MSTARTPAPRSNYTGWLVGLGVIGGVLIVAAALWIHYHG